MSKYYMGVMCGTSLDSFDISVADFDKDRIKVLGFKSFRLKNNLKKEIQRIKLFPRDKKKLEKINNQLSLEVIASIKKTLTYCKIKKNDIACVGFPGITLEHKPSKKKSTYLGDPNLVAAKTSLIVIADFRQSDVNVDGQGAPLSAFFHCHINKKRNDFITFVNLGGFSNITLKFRQRILGFDTGPANYLIDMWCRKKFNMEYDSEGKHALQGNIHPRLLKSLLSHKYFKTKPPKSTGFEDFNWGWLENHLLKFKDINRFDVLSTLTYFTIITISNEINKHKPKSKYIYFCGGGSNNTLLVQGILGLTSKKRCLDINPGVNEKNLESLSFAWLSMMRMESQKIKNTSITGAKKSRLLGAIYR